MILSMTGYGKAESQMENTKIVVELRGLNSKSLDLSTRLAPQLRNKELEIRTIINQRLERGKVDLSIQLESVRITAGETPASPVDALCEMAKVRRAKYLTLLYTPDAKEVCEAFAAQLPTLETNGHTAPQLSMMLPVEDVAMWTEILPEYMAATEAFYSEFEERVSLLKEARLDIDSLSYFAPTPPPYPLPASGAGEFVNTATSLPRMFYFDDPKSGNYFWKQFVAGIVLLIGTTGIDQCI